MLKKLSLVLTFIFLATPTFGTGRVSPLSAPDPFVLGLNERNDVPNSDTGNNDTNSKTVRSKTINTGIKNLVLLIFGQSNCTNIAPSGYTPTNAAAVDNFNILNGQMYVGVDPLLGPSNSNFGPGNIGGRVADHLINNGKFARVILVPFCIGGTSVGVWATTLANNPIVAMKRLAQAGITPGMTNVTFGALWMQGESDHGTSRVNYTNTFVNLVATPLVAAGFNGRIFVNKETWLAGAVDANVQAAQFTDIPNGTTRFQGADADSLNAANRQADNTHFNDAGMAALALLIYNAMAASGAPY